MNLTILQELFDATLAKGPINAKIFTLSSEGKCHVSDVLFLCALLLRCVATC